MAKKTETPAIPDQTDHSKTLMHKMLSDKDAHHYNFFNTKPVLITSGSLILDNFAKVKSGTVLRMGGPAEVGKTSQALLYADNYMKTLPKSKTIYVNAESKFSEEIQARTGMKFVTDSTQWEYGTVFVLQSNCLDTICDILQGMYKQIYEDGGHLCVIIDSVDMLTLKSNLDKGIGENKRPAGVNFMTKEMFRQLCGPNMFFNGLMIIITQYSGTFKIDQYEKEAPSLMEGNKTHALNHQASVALYYRPRSFTSYIKENDEKKPIDPITNKLLGINVRIDIRKSLDDTSGMTIEVPIRIGRIGSAIWTEKELLDTLITMALVTRSGSWITISDEILKWANDAKIELKAKHQGTEQFSEYFTSNQTALQWLVEKIKVWHA
jgi:hypothetical protein